MPGGPYPYNQIFDQAIGEGNLDLAWRTAAAMEDVRLDRALRLVVLACQRQTPDADRAARKFIVRFIREVEPTIEQIKKVADALDCVRTGNFLAPDAKLGMERLARQIERGDGGE